MQAAEVRVSNPVTGFTRTATTDAAGRYVFNNLPPNPYHLTVDVQGFQKLEQDLDIRAGGPTTLDLTLALAGAVATVDVVGHTEDLAGARFDSAYGHRPESDREAAHRSRPRWAESRRDARVARRRRGFQRLLPPHRRPRADTVLDRQPADHRSAEPSLLESDLSGCRSVDRNDHRRRACGIRRQEQPGRSRRHQVGSRSAEAGRQRVLRVWLVQESHGRRQHRRRLPRRRQFPALSAGCAPTGFSIRRSSRRCTTRATA